MSEAKEEKKNQRKLVHVRVTASDVIVEAVATLIGELLEQKGYEIIEQTLPFPSRIPMDDTARVYLTIR